MKDFADNYSNQALTDFFFYDSTPAYGHTGILLGNGCVSGDIARAAAQAYKQGRIKKIIITGGVQSKNPPLYVILSDHNFNIVKEDFLNNDLEADYMQSVLLANGVNLHDIVYVERRSQNTGDNFEMVEPAIRALNTKSAILFGVAYGAPRAYQTAIRVMPDIHFQSERVFPYGLSMQEWKIKWPNINFIKKILINERHKLDPHNPNNYYKQGFCVPVELPRKSTAKLAPSR
jgi:uncharacterized SAM-binding protein YcdF (DUF218 family)